MAILPTPKLVVILGPTACGKSEWGNKLARKFNGEIVVADSRQVYKGLDIGTNKDTGCWEKLNSKKYFMVEGISHHVIDFIELTSDFSLYKYQHLAMKAIKDILKRKKLPLIVGGSCLYISALTENWTLLPGSHSKRLRQGLDKLSKIELLRKLEVKDPVTARKIDKQNKRRLIRALEICYLTGKPASKKPGKGKPLFRVLKIGRYVPRDILYRKIERRVDQMFHAGLVDEVKKLKNKYGDDPSVFSGIGYRQLFEYFDGKISLQEARSLIKRDTRHYARRQMTWWRREKDILWMSTLGEAELLVRGFIS